MTRSKALGTDGSCNARQVWQAGLAPTAAVASVLPAVTEDLQDRDVDTLGWEGPQQAHEVLDAAIHDARATRE